MKIKKLLAFLLCLALLPLNVPLPVARADDSDIFGANIEPNIMIFVDTSGSMADEIPASPYDPATTYTGSKTVTTVYKKLSSGYGVYTTSIAAVTSANARTALSSVGYWSGKIGNSKISLYTGNYLNYITSPMGAQVAKMTIAKRVIGNVINNTEGVRFGLSRFINNGSMGSGGASVVAPMGSSTSALITALNALPTSGYTPLGEALRDIGNYYKGTMSGQTSPIQYDCQPNFVVMMSDGLQNGSVDVRDQATLRRTQDHATWDGMPGTQSVLVHTVGFAVSAGERDAANAVLQQAATNGGGNFYETDNEAQLEAALEDAIRQIMAATFAFATPVVPTTSASGVSRAYLAAFRSNPSVPFWRGYLKAYQRGTDGLVPTDATTGVPLDSALVWEAGAKLNEKSPADRAIYTYVGGSRVEFKTTTGSITNALMGVATDAERVKTIDLLRGVDVNDEDIDGDATEDRPWKLGDIFHSTPVLVTPPFTPSNDASFAAFRTAQAARTAILLAGANDGMLHAFKEADGEELWAFIPPNFLGRLKELSSTSGEHPFLLDGSPTAADVKIQIGSDTSPQWHTIVVFGERRGGNTYTALDITTPTNPVYMWSFTDAKIAETWSDPIIGKVKMNSSTGSTEKFVAIFAGGYDTASNNSHGKAIFAVDVATGTKLWEYSNDGSGGDKQYMNFSIVASPLPLDLDRDGYIDRLYIGDVGGQLWKFDLSAAATLSGSLVNNWTGKRLFAAAPSQTNPPATGEYYPTQAIYAPVNAAYDESGNLWLYFGTGDRNHPNNTSTNRFYGIKDNTDMANGSYLTEANLTNVTSSTTVPTQGWYFTLSANEKILSQADIFNKVVFFSSFTPAATTSCGSGGGDAKLYAIQMASGYAAVDWSTNLPYSTSTSGGSSASNARSKTIGTGIPSKPIVIISDSGTSVTTSVIAATTSQQLPSNPAPPPTSMRSILYWKENY